MYKIDISSCPPSPPKQNSQIVGLSASVGLLYTPDLNGGLEMKTSHSTRVSVGARGPGLSSNWSLGGLLLRSAQCLAVTALVPGQGWGDTGAEAAAVDTSSVPGPAWSRRAGSDGDLALESGLLELLTPAQLEMALLVTHSGSSSFSRHQRWGKLGT